MKKGKTHGYKSWIFPFKNITHSFKQLITLQITDPCKKCVLVSAVSSSRFIKTKSCFRKCKKKKICDVDTLQEEGVKFKPIRLWKIVFLYKVNDFQNNRNIFEFTFIVILATKRQNYARNCVFDQIYCNNLSLVKRCTKLSILIVWILSQLLIY